MCTRLGVKDHLNSEYDSPQTTQHIINECSTTQFPGGLQRLQILLNQMYFSLALEDKRVMKKKNISRAFY